MVVTIPEGVDNHVGKGEIAVSRKVFRRHLPVNRENKGLSDKVSTLSQATNFRLFQTERVCRRQFRFDENGRKFSKGAENTVGKGEIARYKQFLLFPQCFHQTCNANTLKPGFLLERDKRHFVKKINF